jgi:transcriptional regulator with XRE-family HTH domain
MQNPFDVHTFGKNLRRLRTERGYSQERFAHLVDLDRTYIGGIERGERNPSLKAIIRLAGCLEVEPAKLFDSAETKAS